MAAELPQCPKCRRLNWPETRTCGSCGSPLPVATTSAPLPIGHIAPDLQERVEREWYSLPAEYQNAEQYRRLARWARDLTAARADAQKNYVDALHNANTAVVNRNDFEAECVIADRAYTLAQKHEDERNTARRALRETWWMLTSVAGEGTDTQALDHVVRRFQDKYGNVEGWVREALTRATQGGVL